MWSVTLCHAVLYLVFTWSPYPWSLVEITPVLTTFCGYYSCVHYFYVPWLIMTLQWVMMLLGKPHCGTTMGNNVARDIHYSVPDASHRLCTTSVPDVSHRLHTTSVPDASDRLLTNLVPVTDYYLNARCQSPVSIGWIRLGNSDRDFKQVDDIVYIYIVKTYRVIIVITDRISNKTKQMLRLCNKYIRSHTNIPK